MNQAELLQRCCRYAGETGKWDREDLSQFFHRFRPSGKGLKEIYDGVEHGNAVVKRIKEVMRADGTDRGQSVQCRISRPVDEAKALSLVKKAISKIKNLAAELGDDELEELFTAADYHSRPGKLSQYRQNELTNERLFIMCGAVDEIMIDSKAAGAVMFEAAYTLAHSYPLAYYIQWPLVAAEFMTKDPFKPFFDLWHRKVAWRFTKGNSVEVYTPRSAR